MHHFRVNVLGILIVVAVASTELALIVVQPESWEIAAPTLAALLLASQPGLRWMTTTLRYGRVDDANAPALPLRRLRITVRAILIAVAVVAIILWPVHYWRQRPYYEERTKFYGLMADLCANEATLMMHRVESCSARAESGAPWDDPGEEAENLKCCPYPSDRPKNGSWSEQAAVWERAARKSQIAADWHSRMRDYCSGWSPIKPWSR